MSNVKAYLEDIVRDGLHDIAEALKGGSPAGDVQASQVSYDNETSGLLGTNAQEAIDELSTKVNTNASGISDLTTRIGTAEGNITSLDGRLDTVEEDITALESWKNNLDASDIPYGSGTVKDALDSALNPAPSSMSNVDLSQYTIASGNKYVFPSNGYVWVSVPSGTTPATVRIYAKDGASFTFVQTSYPNIFLFPVYKGMMAAASDFSVFRFIRFNY